MTAETKKSVRVVLVSPYTLVPFFCARSSSAMRDDGPMEPCEFTFTCVVSGTVGQERSLLGGSRKIACLSWYRIGNVCVYDGP